MFRRLALTALMALMALMVCTGPVQIVKARAPAIQTRAAVLMDAVSGQILFQEQGTARSFPASTTKLLTALVAVEHGDMNQLITVSQKAIDQAPDSSSCYLNQGEKQKLEYLLTGLLLVSGNDCAVAIAEGLGGGSPEVFVEWMNETAQRLGARSSNFTNPHGLHEANHYTTAADLALIARAAFANPILLQISGQREFQWPGKSNGTYYNHNQMLFTYDGTIGGKTGFTDEARLTLVNAAKRDNRILLGVVMGADLKAQLYGDMAALLDYGFDAFQQVEAVASGVGQGAVPVVGGVSREVPVAVKSSILVSVPKGETPLFRFSRSVPQSPRAPVTAGEELGELQAYLGDQVAGASALVALETVKTPDPFFHRAAAWGWTILKWMAAVAVGLFAFRTTVKAIRRRWRKGRNGHKGRVRPSPDSPSMARRQARIRP